MTREEIQLKLTPGEPHKSEYPGNSWYPSGNADGVIFRGSKPRFIHLNGELVKAGSKLVGKKIVTPSDVEGDKIQARALQYLKYASEEDRTTAFGFTHRQGLLNHQGGLIDSLAEHNKCLRDEREKGYILYHWCAHTEVGKNMMLPEVKAFLKVIPVEDGIFVIVYDPDGDLP